jgi:hypothetical protein
MSVPSLEQGPFDDNCSTMVDFNVPGKPNPPPVNLRLKIGNLNYFDESMAPVAVFTDPSGTLASPTLPLNVWYGISVGENSRLWTLPPSKAASRPSWGKKA